MGDIDRGALQRRTLRVLVAGQILGGAAVGLGAAVAPLLAKEILDDDTFAGLAFAGYAFGAAFAAVPLSRSMARHGRRYGLVRGYGLAAFGSVLAVAAAEIESFPLQLVGMLLFGVGSATGLIARYAGADLAAPERRARSISTVVWATTVGAVAGPNVLGPAGRIASSLALPDLAGPYLLAAGFFAAAAAVIAARLRPDPMAVAGTLDRVDDASRSSIREQLAMITRVPAALVGLATMAVAHGVMVSIMAMTPLHLNDHGGSLEVVGVVISVHLAGMYALSPVVGAVTDRVGALRVAQAAATTMVGAATVAAVAGHGHVLVGAALALLGLGWSMGTIAGSTLITAAAPEGNRARVQGAADMTMGILGGLGGVVSGLVVGTVGYGPLSAIGAVLAALTLGAMLLWGARVPRDVPLRAAAPAEQPL